MGAMMGVVQFAGFYSGVILTLNEVTSQRFKETGKTETTKAFGVEITINEKN